MSPIISTLANASGYGYRSLSAAKTFFVATVGDTSPYINAYPFTTASGFGTKFSNPATLPAASAQDVSFSADNQFIAVSANNSTTPGGVYPWSSTGFGTRYASPTFPGGGGRGIRFNSSTNAITLGTTGSPYINTWAWSSGWGTKYSNPATLPNDYCNAQRSVNFNQDGSAIAIGSASSPYVYAYPFSGGYGTKYANPSTALTAEASDFNWSSNGADLLLYSSSTMHSYAWSSGFGTKYAAPSPSTSVNGLTLNKASNVVGFATGSSPYFGAFTYTVGTGFGTKYADPATTWGFYGQGVGWNSDGTVFGGAGSGSPYSGAIAWSAGFGTKYADPATLPAGTTYSIAFSN